MLAAAGLTGLSQAALTASSRADVRLVWQTPLARRLLRDFFALPDDESPVVLREEDDASAIGSLIAACRLSQREADVRYPVVLAKTSNDIGDILGNSQRTVNKHLERVFEKPGVETRTAAANLAQSGMRGACASPVLVAGRPAPPAGSREGGGRVAKRPAARRPARWRSVWVWRLASRAAAQAAAFCLSVQRCSEATRWRMKLTSSAGGIGRLMK